jgi:hypothetical protein
MKSQNKNIARMAKAIRPYGLTVDRNKHMSILKDGQRVYSFSSTPNCPYSVKNTLKDLVKMGYLPEDFNIRIQ